MAKVPIPTLELFRRNSKRVLAPPWNSLENMVNFIRCKGSKKSCANFNLKFEQGHSIVTIRRTVGGENY
jgi:hypothetical protein